MKILVDTHLLIWAAHDPERLSPPAMSIMGASDNTLIASVACLWEIAIKAGLRRKEFQIDLPLFRSGLSRAGYDELPVLADHAIAVAGLPPLHKDPFDRILIAQAIVEGATLLTSDRLVARYPGPIRLV